MVAAKITLTVTQGSHSGKQFVFSRPARCVAGRAQDCCVRLAGAFEDGLVSRHHCELDVNPPHICVHDLGSRNGTFLNGQRLPPAAPGRTPGQDHKDLGPQYELKDGDELRLGPVPFLVTIRPDPEGKPAA
jgi:pSer/pThr/pTyr-binding forkhead associated (FHA) protein